MPEFISTSKSIFKRATRTFALALGLALFSMTAYAADGAAEKGASSSKTLQPEDDDFSSTPFTEYGEFNEELDEEADAKFFAHGRFFGVSLGLGFEGVTGNRGLLWEGGFPMVDFKLHYWFDFNVALDLGGYVASHFYQTTIDQEGHVDVSMIHLAVDLKYYFDTKNVSSAISFANPFVQIGVGSYTKTQTSVTSGTPPETDTGIGLSAGAGLEFAIKPKKTYLQVEGRYHMARFKDSSSVRFANDGIEDLSGGFYTLNANLLFTW